MGSANSRRRGVIDEYDEAEARDSENSDAEQDIATIVRYLIRSGQVLRIISSDGDHLYTDDSEDDLPTTAARPRFTYNPDTSLINESELKQSILLASGRRRSSTLPSVLDMLQKRERGIMGSDQFSPGDCCAVSSRFLPNKMRTLTRYQHKAFCGTYSQDGNLFLSACQGCNIRLYDSSHQQFKLLKTIRARDVGWSILDTAFSPDGRHLIYSSWSECIHLCTVHGDSETHEALPLCPDDRRFCIFSLVFSRDGREMLGGANDSCLYVYDIERKQRTLKIDSHDDDVNAVAFADFTSQILFSGGDDGFVKVWDRRTLSETEPKPVGVLAGHRDGITFIDSKGDSRHLISNSKDQTIKLWDIRKFSPSDGVENARQVMGGHRWDYRWQGVPRKLSSLKKLNGDTSLMTYAGHCVLQTLIRSRFSPAFSTGQRYIYTGCATGSLIIYDVLTGKVESELTGHRSCVRDVSWHPYSPEIVTSSWDRTLGLWTYNGKHNLDSDEEIEQDAHDEVRRAELAGLRRSRRLAERRQRLRQRTN